MGTAARDKRAGVTRLLLVDDHTAFRKRLREYLDQESDLQVVGEASDGRAAVRMAGDLQPGVVLMDVSIPELNGIDATRLIKRSFPAILVLALSMHRQGSFVESMLEAGASGYLLKENALLRLPGALRIVLDGGTYLCEELD